MATEDLAFDGPEFTICDTVIEREFSGNHEGLRLIGDKSWWHNQGIRTFLDGRSPLFVRAMFYLIMNCTEMGYRWWGLIKYERAGVPHQKALWWDLPSEFSFRQDGLHALPFVPTSSLSELIADPRVAPNATVCGNVQDKKYFPFSSTLSEDLTDVESFPTLTVDFYRDDENVMWSIVSMYNHKTRQLGVHGGYGPRFCILADIIVVLRRRPTWNSVQTLLAFLIPFMRCICFDEFFWGYTLRGRWWMRKMRKKTGRGVLGFRTSKTFGYHNHWMNMSYLEINQGSNYNLREDGSSRFDYPAGESDDDHPMEASDYDEDPPREDDDDNWSDEEEEESSSNENDNDSE